MRSTLLLYHGAHHLPLPHPHQDRPRPTAPGRCTGGLGELSPADAGSLGVEEGDVVRLESPRGWLEAKARISGIKEGVVFAPCHYGYFDEPNGQLRAANELTITEWDPASKQPLYKVGAVKVTKIADADGTPAPAPTNTASAPAFEGQVPGTAGGRDAEVEESVGKE